MRELLEELVQEALRRGASFADLRAGEGTGTSITAEDGRIRDLSVTHGKGVGLRVLVRGAWGFASTRSHEPEDLRRCLEEALAMAASAAGHVAEPGAVAEAEPVEATSRLPYKIDPATVTLTERVARLARLEEAARRHHPAVVNTRARYYDTSGTVELVNSFGTYIRWENLGCGLNLMVTAANEATRQSSYDGRALPAGWEVVAEMDLEEMAAQTAQRAVDLLDAVEPPAGQMSVIPDPEITGLITHEAFGHNCEADLVWAGESIVAGRGGQKLAADIVTIVDDPTLPSHNGSFEYDDEGVPARRHVLLEHGVLKEYLHSLETAAHFSTSPNGAARASSSTSLPQPRMSNTFIEAGDADLEDLIAAMDEGVLLTGAHGGYVDTTRGHFTFSIESGWEVHKGKRGRRIRNCTLTGYTLETLGGVRGLSKHFELLDRGMCGKRGQMVRTSIGGPYTLVESITLGGSRAD